MNDVIEKTATEGDLVLREVWRVKEKLSAEYNHDLKKLLALTREHEKLSGRNFTDFEEKSNS